MTLPYARAVFDCDGVLLDSNGVKVAAFYEAMADEPSEWVEALVASHRQSGGVSRYEKLRRYFADDHPRADADQALVRALERFGAAAKRGLETCAVVPGIREFLGRLNESGVRCVVASGGDESEVKHALAHHGLSPSFEHILGSPTSKPDHMQRLAQAGWFEDSAVFFGDARLDMELAERHGLAFVFVAGYTDWAKGREQAASRGHRVVDDFSLMR